MFKKINNILIIIIFLSGISAPLLFSDLKGGSYSASEKRILAEFPKLISENGSLTPGISLKIKSWIDDNAGFRIPSQNIRAYIDTRLFRVSSNKDVVVGKNGWYFYTRQNNLQIGKGQYHLTQPELDSITDYLIEIDAGFNKRNIDFVFVVIPSKASVYPEFISGGFYTVRNTLIDDVTNAIRENSDILVINVKDDLVEAKKTGQIFFKTDTHWNDAGAYVGYTTIIDELNQAKLISSQPVEIDTKYSSITRDLTSVIGLSGEKYEEGYFETVLKSPNAVRITSGERYEYVKTLFGEEFSASGYQYFQNPAGNGKKALVICDSFFMSFKIPELLAENFSSLEMLTVPSINPQVIAAFQPDIVILEITERFLNISNPDNRPRFFYP